MMSISYLLNYDDFVPQLSLTVLIFFFQLVIWLIFIQFPSEFLDCVIFACEHLFQILVSSCLTEFLLKFLINLQFYL